MQEPNQNILRNIQQFQPEITEKKFRDKRNFLAALVIGTLVVLIALLILTTIEPNYEQRIAIGFVLVIIYAAILFFLLEPKKIQEIHHKEIHQYERPVTHHIIKEIPIVAKEKPQKKYVGSTETKTFHRSTCRFSKLIKPASKVEEDTRNWFEKMDYTPCKSCKP